MLGPDWAPHLGHPKSKNHITDVERNSKRGTCANYHSSLHNMSGSYK